MERSKACGYVLTRTGAGGEPEYLLLVNRERGEPGLPKGHVEPGESERETARRETEEETGLSALEVHPHFRHELRYPATRGNRTYDKTVVYFAARVREGEVRLSKEHRAFEWVSLGEAIARLPFANLRAAVAEHARFHKARALFALAPWSRAEADRWLAALPESDERLLGHLRGAADLAGTLAKALAARDHAVDVAAAEVGTLVHDAGRGLGEHADHQRAGLRHLIAEGHGAHGFACISHFTKGASPDELRSAGLEDALVDDFCRLVDMGSLTAEERCAALADACMKGSKAVHPDERFADLRARYDAEALITLQEARTHRIRAELEADLGQDPLQLLRL